MIEAFAIFTFGFLVGSAVKGWVCGARELRQARADLFKSLQPAERYLGVKR